MKKPSASFTTADAWTHDVRDPVFDGPAGLSDRSYRHRNLGFALCRDQYEDHDPNGEGRARGFR